MVHYILRHRADYGRLVLLYGARSPREFRQAGIENFGHADREEAETEILALILEAVQLAGLRGFQIHCGDLGLFSALLEALPIPAPSRRAFRASRSAARPFVVGTGGEPLLQLDAALVGFGQRSVVVAAQGSVARGKMFTTEVPKGQLNEATRTLVLRRHQEQVEQAIEQCHPDVVHMHGIDFHRYLPQPGVPVLVTLHLPPSWYPETVFRLPRANTFLHCVSAFQRGQCPKGAALLPDICNGVAVEALPVETARRNVALSLGRICPEKNFHEALEASERAGVPFLLALPMAFIGAAAVSVVFERALFRRLYKAGELNQVLFTIGLVFVATAAATFVFGTGQQPIQIPAWLRGSVEIGGIRFGVYRGFLIAIALLITAIVFFGLERTRLGARIRASVDNQRVAQGLGLDVERIFAITFALGSGLAGLGGALAIEIVGLDPSFGFHFLVYVLIVVSVGGLGSVTGSFAGAALLGIGDVAGKYFVPEIGSFLIYLLLVGILLVRPRGLFGKR